MQQAPGSRPPQPAPTGRVATWLRRALVLCGFGRSSGAIAVRLAQEVPDETGSPVLVVHGSLHTMVAPALGRALYEHALPPKRFMLVEGAVHEDTDVVGHQLYRVALRDLYGVGQQP